MNMRNPLLMLMTAQRLTLIRLRISMKQYIGVVAWGRNKIAHGEQQKTPCGEDLNAPGEKTKKKKVPDFSRTFLGWWSQQDSNLWPHRCERCALTHWYVCTINIQDIVWLFNIIPQIWLIAEINWKIWLFVIPYSRSKSGRRDRLYIQTIRCPQNSVFIQ